jgi:hypothetical protein
LREHGPTRAIVDPGRYRFLATCHAYRQLRPYVATILTRVHCLNAPRPVDLIFPTPVEVYTRKAVKSIEWSSLQIRGGDTVAIKIIVSGRAPPSSTRVDLTWAGHTELLAAPPRVVDIPAGRSETSISIVTSSTRAPTIVTVTAATTGKGEAASLTINP